MSVPLRPRFRCHAVGCEVELLPHLVMCARHWAMVPAATKEALAGVSRADGYLATWTKILAEAVAIVAAKEGTDATGSPILGMAAKASEDAA